MTETTSLASAAWLTHRWIVWGAKKGTLQLDGQTLSFVQDDGSVLFSYPLQEIASAGFKASGWVFLKTTTNKVHKVAFFKPTTSPHDAIEESGLLGGHLGGSVVTLRKALSGDAVAQEWQETLSAAGVTV